MSKHSHPGKTTGTTDNTSPSDKPTIQATAPVEASLPVWRLKTGKASKVSKYAEGSVEYQITADVDRTTLFISITGNEGGGYFSRERVPFPKIEACASKCDASKPFPSRSLKDAFVGRSSNNAGFIVAVLRAEGLLGPAANAETQHVITSDWSAWKQSMLAVAGTLIEAVDNAGKTPLSPKHEAEHSKTPTQATTKKS